MSKQLGFSRNKGSGGRQWVHSADTLVKSRVIYNVKFLGHVEVDQPKGAEMVKEAIRKVKFNKQIKKAEGQKSQKVELSISMDAITIQDPKFKVIQFQYPLHLVSYCADDKSDKKMFTFIAKEKASDKHHCFVFDSDRSAEEITLTVGQAFDLAYRRFLETSGKDMESKKQLLVLQKKVQELTDENASLKQRVALLEKLVDPRKLAECNGLGPYTKDNIPKVAPTGKEPQSPTNPAPVPAPRSFQRINSVPVNGSVSDIPVLAPPPPIPNRTNASNTRTISPPALQVDLFGSAPFNVPANPSSSSQLVTSPLNPFVARQGITQPANAYIQSGAVTSPQLEAVEDVFGMGAFGRSSSFDIESELMDMQISFSRGLSFGTEDFSLEDLDPVKKQ